MMHTAPKITTPSPNTNNMRPDAQTPFVVYMILA